MKKDEPRNWSFEFCLVSQVKGSFIVRKETHLTHIFLNTYYISMPILNTEERNEKDEAPYRNHSLLGKINI